jgi:hypothetical protein
LKDYTGEKYVTILRKKSRGGKLKAEDKDYNKSIHSKKATIEIMNQCIKPYAVLDGMYRT